ncbi:hypothetical protein [Rhizobium sp. 16-488-2b]|jgi:hypothetical protein|uniref:hypothetical protein n=1 Tax=Rhizobium sp. 16-488-2b TaxID=2819991 RepID=UPI001ADA1C9F|nr:hypothetical protein [Rhizobium sp. 16-488-2b]MBO9128036.1 hypothetical protein [Rhizobium sp. 16-488-2b]
MKRAISKLLGTAAAIWSLSAAGEAQAATAIEMRDWCREIVLKIDDPTATASTFEAGYCLGSFITLRNTQTLNGLPRVCAPEDATVGDFMRLYVRMVDDMKAMPASLADNWFAAAIVILQYEYPCQN